MSAPLRQFGRKLGQGWARHVLAISGLVLLTAAIGKTVTYGTMPVDAQMVVHQITHISREVVRWVVLVELAMAASLILGLGSHPIRCAMLFTLCCCFVSYRLATWDEGSCGCFVHPAILDATGTLILEGIAWVSLGYMLAGSALALVLGPAGVLESERCQGGQNS